MGKRLPKSREKGRINEIRLESRADHIGRGGIRTALVYPNTYSAGMSSLGFQTVYRLLNQMAGVSCERVFLPEPGNETRPPLSLETGSRLDQFDLILFSISFENDFINLVRMLKTSGIPLRSSFRNHRHPIVAAGGVACCLNPEPIAPFMDLFLLGEAECLLQPFQKAFEDAGDRRTLLQNVEFQIPGAYVPSLHGDDTPFRIPVQYLKKLDHTTTYTSILTPDTAFSNTLLIETLKGCPHGCRFCSTGFIHRPPRIYPAQAVCRAMDKARGLTDKIGLVSSAIADHPDITAICRYGREKGLRLSFSSLRADRLSDDLIQAMADAGVKTATIAPEAGSERMRAVINKKISETTILQATQKLVGAGLPNLRLYFMIGLPFEQDTDANAIVDLTLKIKAEFLRTARPRGKIGTLTLSINPFIPKPFTPFQWAPMERPNTLKRRSDIIRQGLKKTANVRVKIESLKQARTHALLSLGDRRTANILESALAKGWAEAMREYHDFVESFIFREKSIHEPLPWNFLRHNVQPLFLIREWEKAGLEKLSASCPMTDCRACATCTS